MNHVVGQMEAGGYPSKCFTVDFRLAGAYNEYNESNIINISDIIRESAVNEPRKTDCGRAGNCAC